MEALGISWVPDTSAGILTNLLFKDTLVNAAGEVHEALEPLTNATKPWKVSEPTQQIRDHVIEETVDVLFFLVEAWLLAGLTYTDIASQYEAKYQANLKRIVAKKVNAEELDKHIQSLPAVKPLTSINVTEILPWLSTWSRDETLRGEVRGPLGRLCWRTTFFTTEAPSIMRELKALYRDVMTPEERELVIKNVNEITVSFLAND